MSEFVMILGMAAVTFAVRYPVLVLVGKIPLPDRVFRAMRYVPPAVLAAIIVPAVLFPNGESIDISLTNSYLVAGIVSALIAWRTKTCCSRLCSAWGFSCSGACLWGCKRQQLWLSHQHFSPLSPLAWERDGLRK